MAMSICDTKCVNMYIIKLTNTPPPLKRLLEIPNDYLWFYIKQEAHGPHLSPKKQLHPSSFFSFLKNNGITILLMKYNNSVNQYVFDRSMHRDTPTLSSILARSDHYAYLATIRITTPLACKRLFNWISMERRLVRVTRDTSKFHK